MLQEHGDFAKHPVQLNAGIVAKIGVNALIATLGTMTIVRGIALTICRRHYPVEQNQMDNRFHQKTWYVQHAICQ